MKNFIKTINITKLKNKVFKANADSLWPSTVTWGIGLTLGAFALLSQFHEKSDQALSEKPPLSLDTYIPEGESLVPIQVSNYESLDQVIGQYGVVDLLSTPLDPSKKPRRVAFAVKLIRSPRSPRHFSVLIPVEEAPKLAGYTGEFTVVVRNPKSIGTKFVKEKTKPRTRRVVFETEKL